jgi:hypothetical protein
LIANNPHPHEQVNKNEKYHRERERERERESIDLWDILVLSNLLTKKYIIELIYTNFILFFNYK